MKCGTCGQTFNDIPKGVRAVRPLPPPGLSDTDKLALESACECFRLFVVLEDSTALDALCEVLHARTARVDPDWKRPEVMGKAPSAAVVAMMEGVG